ncbi:MAG: prepilin peptidase [Proteobacteria bacterium]|nr:prepilin peptidase [Pseudomonadota bacterium]
MAVRAVRGEHALMGRSQCDGCGTALSFAQTVPVISYLAHGGSCSVCGGKIDPTHVIGELGGGAVGLCAMAAAPWPRMALLGALGLTLLGSALIDARTRRLPDILTLLIAACGAGLSVLKGQGVLLEGLVAAAVAFLLAEGVRRGFLWLNRSPGLGFGDVKLIAALALWLGAATPWMVVAAALIGLVGFLFVRTADGRLPFGPSLALGAWIIGLAREAGLWPLA